VSIPTDIPGLADELHSIGAFDYDRLSIAQETVLGRGSLREPALTSRKKHQYDSPSDARQPLRVALIHYWLVTTRGGEKVLEALCELFPQADIFTHVVVPDAISQRLRSHRIYTSFIARLPFAKKWYKRYLPLMPLALEQLDLREYDLVISSESGPAKGVIAPPNAVHICYCHTPMRYLWNMYHEYHNSSHLLIRICMPVLAHYLRNWDQNSALRVDKFITNSRNVAERVQRYYRRTSDVIYPPVDVDRFVPVSPNTAGEYYLMVGELVGYKRPELAVEAFNVMGKPFVIVGGGEMLHSLRRQAGPNVTILGHQSPEMLARHYRCAKALVFPGEEDFGIVPVEAMASGRPVIAYARGGAVETIVDGVTGVLFHQQSVASLTTAVDQFETMHFDPAIISAHARAFSKERFKDQMRDVIDRELSRHLHASREDPFRDKPNRLVM
jgi:glycosyltransferase involved in cell wall biosynthesis